MKLLHSADWHLDSPLQGFRPEQTALLKDALLALPMKLAALCREEGCDMWLLSGDLFDGPASGDSVKALRFALEEAAVPVFIAPGNHDYYGVDSPWQREIWPGNVYIFTKPELTLFPVPELDCRVYGAGFTGIDCPPLLTGFRAEGEGYAIGVLHGDPTQVNSPYCPITSGQVLQSNLDYLALGHIHKGGSFRAGKTLCAWPGCPMGRGYDEQGEKGVLVVTIGESAEARFLPLDTSRFYELETAEAPAAALEALLPPVGNRDFYRVTFTGRHTPPDLTELTERFRRFPNLTLRDRTSPPVDVWGSADADTLEGMFFRLLQQRMEDAPETALLAAELARKLLDGEEVRLP